MRKGGGGLLEQVGRHLGHLSSWRASTASRRSLGNLLRAQIGRCLLEERQLVVVGGKGGKDRVIPITERLASVLADLFLTEGIEPEQFLWYGGRGNQLGYRAIMRSKPIGEGTFHRWWKRCLYAASVRYRNPHTARHTFATHWLKRGARMETLSKAMGHASIATTVDLYGHLDLSDVARDLALVEGYGINPLQSEGL